jgi:hypothetical protein
MILTEVEIKLCKKIGDQVDRYLSNKLSNAREWDELYDYMKLINKLTKASACTPTPASRSSEPEQK